MLRVPIAQAKAGMVLALPLIHPRRHDTVLLKPGMPLDERSIARLQEIEIRDLWIRYPGIEFLAEYISPELVESQAALTSKIAGAFDAVAQGAHAKLDYGDYRAAITSLLARLTASPKAGIFIQEMADNDEPALRHSSSVCLMSIMMGLKLEDYLISERSRLGAVNARDVSSLGVGAMLHDIGMLRLPPEVAERWNSTRDESDPAWRQHVHIGFEMIKDAVGPAAAASVLHHHQKFDGTGFPRRARMGFPDEPVAGSDIHVFARIIAAADVFDRLRHAPGTRSGAAPVVRVLRQLQEPPYKSWLDPMVYKALLAVAPAYAPGTMVTLSSGITGAVVEWFADDPCRPTVQTIGDPAKDFASQGFRSERFVLRKDAKLTVVRAEGVDVSGDNFYPVSPGQFDLRLAGKAIYNAAAAPAA
jgi:HD-GYP domain-containing protein (c-di-GMP phosphodiesterase class II)